MADSNKLKQSSSCFETAANVLESLEEIPITKEFGVESISSNPPLLLITSIWNQSMLLRVRELGNASINLRKQNRLVSAAILTRCLLETVALYYHVKTTLEDVINETRPASSAVEELWRVGRGRDCRNLKLLFKGAPQTTQDYKAVELENFRKVLTQKCQPLKYTYSELSEYVHPNATGTSEAYTNPNQENLSFVFDGNFDHISHNTGYVLEFGLNMFKQCWLEMEGLIPRFMEICK